MSIKFISKLWETGPEKQSHLLILLALADFANDAGECWPSMATVARKARMTERGARKIVRQLETKGWLTIHTGGGRHGCNKYHLNLEQETGNDKPGTELPTEQNSLKPGTEQPKTRNSRSAKPSGTIKEPSSKSARDILREILREETADDFIEHRKKMKSPITPEAAKRLVKKAACLPDPDAVFDESIENGWRGIFPKQQNSAPLFDLSKHKE